MNRTIIDNRAVDSQRSVCNLNHRKASSCEGIWVVQGEPGEINGRARGYSKGLFCRLPHGREWMAINGPGAGALLKGLPGGGGVLNPLLYIQITSGKWGSTREPLKQRDVRRLSPRDPF